MPATKRTVRKVAKKPARKAAKTTKGATARRLSPSHKKALAEGRTMSATVNRYLSAVNTPKRRGRKVSASSLDQRLAEARATAKSATGVNKVLAAQAVRDLQERMVVLSGSGDGTDIKNLEAEFVRIAKEFGENRGIGYWAWRDAGVPASVLAKAGIARARG